MLMHSMRCISSLALRRRQSLCSKLQPATSKVSKAERAIFSFLFGGENMFSFFPFSLLRKIASSLLDRASLLKQVYELILVAWGRYARVELENTNEHWVPEKKIVKNVLTNNLLIEIEKNRFRFSIKTNKKGRVQLLENRLDDIERTSTISLQTSGFR